MSATGPSPDDVGHLLRNAELRDELEPFSDDSLLMLNSAEVPTPVENEFLESMLAWERAPVLPIARWFEPELKLPPPEELSDEELHDRLWRVIHQLYSRRIVLDFTDHLSDRELYVLIFRDILPSQEKRIDARRHYLHWDCADVSTDPETWLRYYATNEERQCWVESTTCELPPPSVPPYPRELPWEPL